MNGRVFKEWCEYLARGICSVHRDSELCIGYFLVDIPAWVNHGSGKGDWPTLEGLSEVEREEKIGEMAEGYYSTICTAVRAVDPNHLIFGDRFNGNRGIPRGVITGCEEARRCAIRAVFLRTF